MSSISFYQQDQNWQNSQQVWAQRLSNNNAFFSIMQSALTNQTTGLASVANQAAINRVNSQIVKLLNGGVSPTATSKNSVPAARPQPDVVPLASNSANSQTGSTAASLLAGEIPLGSILSVLA